MTHLTRDELLRWRDHVPPADRDRIVGHLAVCDTCGALYAELVRTRPAEHPAARLDPAEFVERGYRAYAPSRASAWTLRGWRAWSAVAAALVLVIGGAILAPTLQQRPPLTSGGSEVRGASIQIVSPAGIVTPPVTFRWSSPVRATTYSLEVRDETQAIVYSTKVREEEVTLPSDLRNGLRPGGRYSWVVVALDGASEEIMRSAPQAFVVSGASR